MLQLIELEFCLDNTSFWIHYDAFCAIGFYLKDASDADLHLCWNETSDGTAKDRARC